MQPIVLTIEAGKVRFLLNADTAPFVETGAITRRASHVEPVNFFLRFIFHSLRYAFGETGCIADFTRRFPCLWRVNLAPVGGPILPGCWRDRSKAIAVEVDYLSENFL